MTSSKTARSLLTLAVISFLVVLAPGAEAQVARPAKRTPGPVDPSNPTMTAVNPEVLALKTSSDLIIKDLGFTGKGEITFELKNRGDVPINPGSVGVTPTEQGSRTSAAVPEDKQIKVTVYLNDTPFRTVFQPRLEGKQSKTFTLAVPETTRPRCAQSRPLKTVIDPANVIVELTDTNNVNTLAAVRPCPDLAIESIEKNWNDLKTEYVGRVTLVNKGNAVAESFEYMSGTGNNSHFTSIPDFGDETGGPLAPGETMKYNMGSAFAYEKMNVWVWIDRRGFVEEVDESNNQKEKTLD